MGCTKDAQMIVKDWDYQRGVIIRLVEAILLDILQLIKYSEQVIGGQLSSKTVMTMYIIMIFAKEMTSPLIKKETLFPALSEMGSRLHRIYMTTFLIQETVYHPCYGLYTKLVEARALKIDTAKDIMKIFLQMEEHGREPSEVESYRMTHTH